MNMKHIIIITFIIISGCSSMPSHIYGTDKIIVKDLAVVTGKFNEIRILEVDNKPYAGGRSESFYLPPGTHKFKALLSWDDLYVISGVGVSINTSSPYVKTGCLNLESGKKYTIAASDGTKDWRLVYFKTFFEKSNLSSCHEN